MQQRTTGSSRGPDRDDSFMDVEAQLEAKLRQSSWRRRMESTEQLELPISDPGTRNIGKRQTAQARFTEHWLHAIPLIVLLCFFILWWFSYPVRLVFKDGRVVAIHRIEISRELNESRIDLALLASASSPGAWSFQNVTRTNVTEAPNGYQSGFGDQQWKSHGLTH